MKCSSSRRTTANSFDSSGEISCISCPNVRNCEKYNGIGKTPLFINTTNDYTLIVNETNLTNIKSGIVRLSRRSEILKFYCGGVK